MDLEEIIIINFMCNIWQQGSSGKEPIFLPGGGHTETEFDQVQCVCLSSPGPCLNISEAYHLITSLKDEGMDGDSVLVF